MTAYDPLGTVTLEREWFIGSEHGNDDAPDYRYNTTGWPYFIGVKETRVGRADFHVATGIQCLNVAQSIVAAHNASL